MNKQLLSIKQMQHLQELGLDTNNASACWYKPEYDTEYIEMFGIFKKKELTSGEECIPAYTLQDVLDALPKEINSRTRRFWLRIDLDDECLYYYYDNYNLVEIRKIMFGYNEMEELIDAAYEMLCWCIEQGHVKTGKEGKE